MPRLVNSQTGVVIDVSDKTAAGLSSEWITPKAPKGESEDKPTRRRASS